MDAAAPQPTEPTEPTEPPPVATEGEARVDAAAQPEPAGELGWDSELREDEQGPLGSEHWHLPQGQTEALRDAETARGASSGTSMAPSIGAMVIHQKPKSIPAPPPPSPMSPVLPSWREYALKESFVQLNEFLTEPWRGRAGSHDRDHHLKFDSEEQIISAFTSLISIYTKVLVDYFIEKQLEGGGGQGGRHTGLGAGAGAGALGFPVSSFKWLAKLESS